MDTEYDDAVFELMKLKREARTWGKDDYVGVDVRIRQDIGPTIRVTAKEEDLPENTSDDDISRLKEKLELMKQIQKMQEILEKFVEEHPDYLPARYPPIKVPSPYYTPWPNQPWRSPFWCQMDNTANDESIRINWAVTDSDGNWFW